MLQNRVILRYGTIFHPALLITIFCLAYLSFPNVIMERSHWGLVLFNGSGICKGSTPYVNLELPHGIFIPVLNCLSSKIFINSISTLSFTISLFLLIAHMLFYVIYSKEERFWLLGLCSLTVFAFHPFPLHAWPEYVAAPFLFLAIFFISTVHQKLSLKTTIFIATNLACVVLIRHSNIIICAPLFLYLALISFRSFIQVVFVCVALAATFFLVFYLYFSVGPVLLMTSYLGNLAGFASVFSIDPLGMARSYLRFMRLGVAFQGPMIPHVVILSGFLFSLCDFKKTAPFRSVFIMYIATYVLYILFGHTYAFESWRIFAMFGPLLTISIYYSVVAVWGFFNSLAWEKLAKSISICIICFFASTVDVEVFKRPWYYFSLPNYYWPQVVNSKEVELLQTEYKKIGSYYTNFDEEFRFYSQISDICKSFPDKILINHTSNSVVPLVCDNEIALRDSFHENQVYFRGKFSDVAGDLYNSQRFDKSKYILLSQYKDMIEAMGAQSNYTVYPIGEYVSPRLRGFHFIY